MYRFAYVPRFDALSETLCGAVALLQSHRSEEPSVVEPVWSLCDVDPTAHRKASDPPQVFGIVTAPAGSAPPSHARDVIAEIESVRAAQPHLRLMPIVPRGAARGLARLDVTPITLPAERSTSYDLAARLWNEFASPFVLDFSLSLPEALPSDVGLLIARLLEDLEANLGPTADELLAACERSRRRVEASLEKQCLGAFDDWCDRARVYACVRGVQGGAPLRQVVDESGFPSINAFVAACRRLGGACCAEVLDGAGRGAAVVEARLGSAVRQNVGSSIAARSEPSDGHEQAETAARADPVADSLKFDPLVQRFMPMVRRAVASVVDGEDVQSVVWEVFDQLWQLGPERWPELSENYTLSAALNRARNQRRAERRRPPSVDAGEVDLPCTGPTPDQEVARQDLRATLLPYVSPLPARSAFVVWRCGAMEWSPGDVARLLGTTPGAVRGVRARSLQALRKDMERPL